MMRNMFGLLKTPAAQTISEYAILLTLITVGLITMQVFVRRGLSARYKDAVDYATDHPGTNFTTAQYEPFYTKTNSTSAQDRSYQEEMGEGGWMWTKDHTNSTVYISEYIYNAQ